VEFSRRQLSKEANSIATSLDLLIAYNSAKAELYGMQQIIDYPSLLIQEIQMQIDDLNSEIAESENGE